MPDLAAREQELLLQLATAKEAYRLTGADEDRAAKAELADQLRGVRERMRAGRTEMVGGDAVRED